MVRQLMRIADLKYLQSFPRLAAMADGVFATIGVMEQRFPIVTDMTDVLCAFGEE